MPEYPVFIVKEDASGNAFYESLGNKMDEAAAKGLVLSLLANGSGVYTEPIEAATPQEALEIARAKYSDRDVEYKAHTQLLAALADSGNAEMLVVRERKEEQTKGPSVFLVTHDYSNVPSGYYEDLAVDAARSGNRFHQGLGVEGQYTDDDIKGLSIDEATKLLQERYPNHQINYYKDMGIFCLETETKPIDRTAIALLLKEIHDDVLRMQKQDDSNTSSNHDLRE